MGTIIYPLRYILWRGNFWFSYGLNDVTTNMSTKQGIHNSKSKNVQLRMEVKQSHFLQLWQIQVSMTRDANLVHLKFSTFTESILYHITSYCSYHIGWLGPFAQV